MFFQVIPWWQWPHQVQIHTYRISRWPMAIMPLATKNEVLFEDPSVVDKSYPRLLEALQSGRNLKTEKQHELTLK